MTKSKSKGNSKVRVSTAPLAKNYTVVPTQPKLKTLDNNRTLLQGHEEIATIHGSTDFFATRFRVNPGLPMYSRLSQIASTFEKYRFRKLEFVYIPAEAITTTPGVLYMAADFDPVDPAPSSISELSTYECQSSGRVYDSVHLKVPVSRMFDGVQTKKTRCGPVAGDLQLYDGCSLSVATSSSPVAPLGQLWVFYEVEFISPQVKPKSSMPQTISILENDPQTFPYEFPAPLKWRPFTVNGLELNSPDGLEAIELPCGTYHVMGSVGVGAAGSTIGLVTGRVFAEHYNNGGYTELWSDSFRFTDHSSTTIHEMPVNFFVPSDGNSAFRILVEVTGEDLPTGLTQASRAFSIQVV